MKSIPAARISILVRIIIYFSRLLSLYFGSLETEVTTLPACQLQANSDLFLDCSDELAGDVHYCS